MVQDPEEKARGPQVVGVAGPAKAARATVRAKDGVKARVEVRDKAGDRVKDLNPADIIAASKEAAESEQINKGPHDTTLRVGKEAIQCRALIKLVLWVKDL